MVTEYRPAQMDTEGSMVPVNLAKCRANVVYGSGDNGQCRKNGVVFDAEGRGWCHEHSPRQAEERYFTLSARQLQSLLEQAVELAVAGGSVVDIVATLFAHLNAQPTTRTKSGAH